MKRSYIIKQRIKNLLLTLPGIKNLIIMRDKARKQSQNVSLLSEEEAKHFVDLDLAAIRERQPLLKEALSGCSDLVSIIIVNRNGLQKLQILMESFRRCDFYEHFEIIFTDNASSDESVAYMQSQQQEFNIRIIQNRENRSFSAANNQGAAEASGEYLLFLNNDTEVTNGWLDELLLAMKTADHPGAVGAKLIYPHIPEGTVNEGKSWLIQHAGIAFRPIMWQKVFYFEPYNMENGMPDDHPEDRLIERAGVTAAALLIRKSVFEEIGCFDENYLYGYEDVDLCLKLHQAGYKNYYCPTGLLFHYESATIQKDYSEERERRWEHNAAVFKTRWEKYISEQILAEKDSGQELFSENHSLKD